MPYPIMREILIVTCTVAGAVLGLFAARSFQMGDAVDLTGAFLGWAALGGFAEMCLTRSQRDD
jgi:hypothetical protein